MFKDIFKQMFKFNKTDPYLTKFYKNIMSGAAAGSLSLVFVYSLDYCRTKLANDIKGAKKGSTREFNGMMDVYAKTWQTDGIVGLYRGFVISCVGIAIYRGFYFGLYDSLKPIIIGEKSSFILDFSLGYAITVIAGLLSYPVDTIRRRMMMTSGQKVKYRGSIDCTTQILQKEGVKAMFHGAGANILRGMAGAGVLSGFDKFKEIYIYLRFGNK
jgi:solute carrier family 25 (adenine nucleotide translocator) protein 4/5/6/31